MVYAGEHAGGEVKNAVTSAVVEVADLQICQTYTAGIKADSIGFISVKDAAGTTRKLMVQDV